MTPALDSAEVKPRWFWTLAVLMFLGLAARFALLSISIGSGDALIIEDLASRTYIFGLYETYRNSVMMTHPPLRGWLEVGILKYTQAMGWSFAQPYKLLVVLADCATCFLLLDIWRRRGGAIAGLTAGALYAWNLSSILVSAHHCNNDPVYSMLALLALWLVEIKNRPFLAGLALGLSINLKLIPGLLLLPMLILSRSRRELLLLLGALGLMSLPILYVWIDMGWWFQMRVLQYRPSPSGWGLHALIDQLSNHPLFKSYLDTVADRYRRSGTYIVMGFALWAIVRMRASGKRDRFAGAAAAAAVYAAVAPTMATQHTVFPGVMLFAADVRAGVIWATLSGLGALMFYLFHWDGSFPILTLAPISGSPMMFINALAWGWVAFYAWRIFRSGPSH